MSILLGANIDETYSALGENTPALGDVYFGTAGKVYKFVIYDTGAGPVRPQRRLGWPDNHRHVRPVGQCRAWRWHPAIGPDGRPVLLDSDPRPRDHHPGPDCRC